MATIRIKRGDSLVESVDIMDCEGNLIDCTGWTIYFTVRSSVPPTSDSDDNDAIISKTIDGSSTGQHTLTLTKEDTNIDPGNYLFDFQANPSANEVDSTETGVFVIQADITRS